MKRNLTLLLIIMSFMMTIACANDEAENISKKETANKQNIIKEMKDNMMNIQFGDYSFTATLVDNSTTKTLKEMLAKGPVTINMEDYGNMEKVGPFSKSLPRNDESITAEAGDLILYQGKAFVIYYESNSWNFTRIGKINNVTKGELKKALGRGNVKVTLSLD